ncbi:MAG: tetratricopeptide repeat protein [Kiritimatiellia bacterium]
MQTSTERVDLLERAWEEYRFLSLDQAEKYFKQVRAEDGDPERIRQAMLGIAMARQYREGNPDYESAETLYQEILEMNAEGEIGVLVRSNLADLYLVRGQEEKALALLNDLIDNHLQTVIGQDALLRRIQITMGDFGSERSVQVARAAEGLLAEVQSSPERPFLIPVLSNLLGEIYFNAKLYSRAAEHLERFTTVGTANTTNYSSQASQLYRLAKIYEIHLNDIPNAGFFYRRLATEYSNSPMAYYALEKAIRAQSITREEAENLRLGGVTAEVLDELFANVNGGNN